MEQGYSRREAGRSLGVDAKMLGRWVRESEADTGQAFRGHGQLTPEQAKLRQLKEENRRLKLEKEILKKATVFCYAPRCFAKETQ